MLQMRQGPPHHSFTLQHALISAGVAAVFGLMAWSGNHLLTNIEDTVKGSAKTATQTHDQVLINTVKLNELQNNSTQLKAIHDRVSGLEYRMKDVEGWQNKHGHSGSHP